MKHEIKNNIVLFTKNRFGYRQIIIVLIHIVIYCKIYTSSCYYFKLFIFYKYLSNSSNCGIFPTL